MALAKRYAILIKTDWPLLGNQFLSIKEDVGGSVLITLRMFGENPFLASRLYPQSPPPHMMLYRASRLINPLPGRDFTQQDKLRYLSDIIMTLQHDIFEEIYG